MMKKNNCKFHISLKWVLLAIAILCGILIYYRNREGFQVTTGAGMGTTATTGAGGLGTTATTGAGLGTTATTVSGLGTTATTGAGLDTTATTGAGGLGTTTTTGAGLDTTTTTGAGLDTTTTTTTGAGLGTTTTGAGLGTTVTTLPGNNDLNLEAVGKKLSNAVSNKPMEGAPELDAQVSSGLPGSGSMLPGIEPQTTSNVIQGSEIIPEPTKKPFFNLKFVDLSKSAELYKGANGK